MHSFCKGSNFGDFWVQARIVDFGPEWLYAPLFSTKKQKKNRGFPPLNSFCRNSYFVFFLGPIDFSIFCKNGFISVYFSQNIWENIRFPRLTSYCTISFVVFGGAQASIFDFWLEWLCFNCYLAFPANRNCYVASATNRIATLPFPPRTELLPCSPTKKALT